MLNNKSYKINKGNIMEEKLQLGQENHIYQEKWYVTGPYCEITAGRRYQTTTHDND